MSTYGSRVPRWIASIALIASFALLAGGVANAAPGDVDTSFGTAGATTVAVGGAADSGGIVRRSDGSYIIGASVGNAVMTVALKKGGDTLMSYGTNGISSFPVSGSTEVTITDIAMPDNDRALVAGWEDATSGSDRFVVARFRKGGGPDPSFSGDGVARIGFPQGDAYGYGVAIQPNGKIVVVGEVDPESGVSNSAIVRLDPDGSIDTSFGDHGRQVVKLHDGVKGYDSPWRVVVQAHGKLAMAGWAERGIGGYRTMALRLKPNGNRDTSFGGDGFAVIDADGGSNWAYGLAKDGDKLVLGLHTSTADAGFMRLTAHGKRDKTFDGDGVAIHGLSVDWEVDGVAVLPDHRIVGVNGFLSAPNVVQLKKGGGLDGGFGSGGEALGPLTNVIGTDIILIANGKIVVTGTSGSDVFAARFDGP